MSDLLIPGNRIRVTERNRVQGYEGSDKSMVQAVASIPAIGDQLHYQMAMDRDEGVGRVVFTAFDRRRSNSTWGQSEAALA